MGRINHKRQKTNVGSPSREPSSSVVPRIEPQNDSDPSQIVEPRPVEVPLRDGTCGVAFTLAEHQERLERLKDREHLITKFADVSVLCEFRIENGVRTLLKKGGLEGFLEVCEETYPRLTLEFLCTLEVKESNKGMANTLITFELFGKACKMTYEQVASAFGWVYADGPWEPPVDRTAKIFWHNMTGEHFRGNGTDKVRQIPHPAFRYVYRFLSMTIFAQGDPSSVKLKELKYLWALTNEGHTMPNWVDLFVKKCLQLQKSQKGNLSLGGMVTLLARHLKVAIPPECVKISGDVGAYYDRFTLRHIRFLKFKKVSEKLVTWILDGSHSGIALPPTSLNLFDIGTQDTVHSLQVRVLEGHGPPPPPPIEPRDESDDESEYQFDDEDEGDVDYDPDAPEPSEESWQQHLTQQLSAISASFTEFRNAQSERMLALETRVTTMLSYQESLLDYFVRVGGGDFRDPRQPPDTSGHTLG